MRASIDDTVHHDDGEFLATLRLGWQEREARGPRGGVEDDHDLAGRTGGKSGARGLRWSWPRAADVEKTSTGGPGASGGGVEGRSGGASGSGAGTGTLGGDTDGWEDGATGGLVTSGNDGGAVGVDLRPSSVPGAVVGRGPCKHCAKTCWW